MAPAARPVPGLVKDALIIQAGPSNPRSMASSTNLITDAGLIGQFLGKPVIRLQGWRMLREELSARPLAIAPNWPSDSESMAPDQVGRIKLAPPAKEWRIWGKAEGEVPVRSSPQLYSTQLSVTQKG